MNVRGLRTRIDALVAKFAAAPAPDGPSPQPEVPADPDECRALGVLLLDYAQVLRDAAARAGYKVRGFWPDESVFEVLFPAEAARCRDLSVGIETCAGPAWEAALRSVRQRETMGIDIKAELMAAVSKPEHREVAA